MEREEQAYWRIRDSLLDQYRGKFVAIVDGKVAASGDRFATVSHEARRKTGSKVKFVTLVGEEDFEFVIRRAVGRFVRGSRFLLPMVDATISDAYEERSVPSEFVVDTGADISIVTEPYWHELALWDTPAGFTSIRGIGSLPERRALFDAIIKLGGYSVDVSVDVRDDLAENIHGRDVINEFALTLCAKREQVEFEWVD